MSANEKDSAIDQNACNNSPDDHEEPCLTLNDVLEYANDISETATSVLAASDDRYCSYPDGYIARQALYACATCSSAEDGKALPAGVCLACSYACHEGHDLYELYTKRNFRCDCGNNRFPRLKCSLFPAKALQNPGNIYNHNFSGKYCRCDRPYPDPDATEPEEMVQCVICEDWFHLAHVGLGEVDSDDVEELICDNCMKAHSFLWRYHFNLEVLDAKTHEESINEKNEENAGAQAEFRGDLSSSTDASGPPPAKAGRLEPANINSSASNYGATADKVADSSPDKQGRCIFAHLAKATIAHPSSGAVWPKTWRRLLCTCSSCRTRYENEKLSFLLNEDDSVQAYEERGKQKDASVSSADPLMQALDRMEHVTKLTVINGYNNLKASLKEFFHANRNKVITEKDINDFFERMNSRPKTSESSFTYLCR